MLPAWLRDPSYPSIPVAQQRAAVSFRDKMLARIHGCLGEDLLRQKVQSRRGLWQSLEPRVRIASTAVLLLAVAATNRLVMIAAVHVFLLVAAWLSGVPVRWFFRRVWLTTLAFTGVVALPAALAWVTPGKAVWTLGGGIYFTRQGLAAAVMLIARAAASLGLIQLLLVTTAWPVFTRVLRSFGLPASLVMVLDLCYRFLFVFLALLADFCDGCKSRLVGGEKCQQAYQWIGATLAGMVRLALAFAGDIADAMYARGYSGAVADLTRRKVAVLDIVWLAGIILLAYIVMEA